MKLSLNFCWHLLRDQAAGTGRTWIASLVALGLLIVSACGAHATTFVVNTTSDTNDGVCSTSAGGCSYSDAIAASNANGGTTADTVTFNIPKSDSGYNASTGVFTIDSPWESRLTGGRVTINGGTQTTFTGDTNVNGPEIEISGYDARGISLRSNDNVVKNLLVNGYLRQISVVGDSNTIESCYLGVNSNGDGPAPYSDPDDPYFYGIEVISATNTVIGGNTAAKGNTIGYGVNGMTLFDSSNTTIQYNIVRNTSENAIWLFEDCNNTSISFNTISGAGEDGISVSGTGNSIRRNSIYGNKGLGINLSYDYVTANDAGDGDSGDNELQNFPVLTGVISSDGNTTVQMSLNSTANSTFTIDVYRLEASDISTSGSYYYPLAGYGSGRTWVGQTTITTDASGNGTKSLVVTGGSANSFYCATATSSANNTSEFSFVRQVGGASGSVVTNTKDSGLGSLRNALNFIELSGGVSAITFNIPKTDAGYNSVTGVFTIKLYSTLPSLDTGNFTIDGATQTVFTGNTNPYGPEVEITAGSSLFYDDPDYNYGLRISSDGNSVRNLMINGFARQIYVFRNLNTIEGCYIGVDATGTRNASSNDYFVPYSNGIFVYGSSKTVIGGDTAAKGNIIGYGQNGIRLQVCSNTTIQNNEICYQSKSGTDIYFGSNTSVLFNKIHNVTGVALGIRGTGYSNLVRQNSIYDNSGLGIDLGTDLGYDGVLDGVTANDTKDGDAGPNYLQNFPVITGVTAAGSNTIVQFSLNSAPNNTYTVDVYRTPTSKILSNGYGPGMTWVGQTSLSTDSNGNGTASLTVTGIVAKSSFVATTTRSNNTSEFSVAKALGTVSGAPLVVSATPASGSSAIGVARTTTVTYSDPNGVSDIAVARLLVASFSGSPALYSSYDAVANKLYLYNDAGTTLVGGYAPGAANVISNSQGSLNCQNTTVSRSGNTLTVNWNFTPKVPFSGAKNLSGWVSDKSGVVDGLVPLGTWSIVNSPLNGSVTPTSGSSVAGTQRLLSATYIDNEGATNIRIARILINGTTSTVNQLYGYYDCMTNKLYLYNNAGTALLGGFAPGSDNVITNSQGTLNCKNTTVRLSGTTLTVNWAFTPYGSFKGAKNIHLRATNKSGYINNWEQKATWTITGAAGEQNPKSKPTFSPSANNS